MLCYILILSIVLATIEGRLWSVGKREKDDSLLNSADDVFDTYYFRASPNSVRIQSKDEIENVENYLLILSFQDKSFNITYIEIDNHSSSTDDPVVVAGGPGSNSVYIKINHGLFDEGENRVEVYGFRLFHNERV